MASTYSPNNGIELIGDGEQSGTWGGTTNTNWELVDEALEGQVSVTLPSTGTSGSPNTLTITDGASSDGRHRYVNFTDGADIGGTAYVRLDPSDAEKIMYVRNSLSAGRSILLFQGTYNASNDYELGNGETAIVKFDGQGAGSTCVLIGRMPTDTQADELATYASTPLTAAELAELQNIGTTTISSVQWGYLGGLAAAPVEDGDIGTTVQAWDANLDQIAALTPTNSNFIVGNGSAWVVENGATARSSLGLGSIATQDSTSVTITGGTITGITDLAIADGGTSASTAVDARANLGLTIGTNVQAWDANLDQVAALTPTDSNFIVGNGSAWVAESGATARTSLGLGDAAVKGVTGVDANAVTGTAGTSGNVATWNADGDLVDGGYAPGALVRIGSFAPSLGVDTTLEMTGWRDTAKYDHYLFKVNNLYPSQVSNPALRMRISQDNGSTWWGEGVAERYVDRYTLFGWGTSGTDVGTDDLTTNTYVDLTETGADDFHLGATGEIKLWDSQTSGVGTSWRIMNYDMVYELTNESIDRKTGFCMPKSLTAINGIKFYWSDGSTFVSGGSVEIYGYRKA